MKFRPLWTPISAFQTRCLAAGEFEVLIGGAKGCAKSDLGLIGAVRQVDKERYKALVCRETGPQLLELIDRSHRLFPKMAGKPAWNGSDRRWTWATRATLKFEAIDTVKDINRIQGQEWSHIFHDEIGNQPDERVADLEQAEIRSPDPSIIRHWRGSANPGKGGHGWIKRRFIEPCGRDGRRIIVRRITLPNGMEARLSRRFIPGTVLDNPIYANDPQYLAQLATLPEVLRRQLLYGDWDAGYGTALAELNEHVHICRPFRVPDVWPRWGAFDYGFAHNWVWIEFASDEDGDVVVRDTTHGRRHQVHEIAERVTHRLDVFHPSYGYTDSDSYAFQSRKERDQNAPTIADLFRDNHNLLLRQGNTDRMAGLQNLRYYIAWRGIGPEGADGRPGVRFMDTPGNRWLFQQLQAMVVDPDDMEDVLKVNSNPETGEGGDDGYDAFRVGMASRPPRAIGTFYKGPVQAFSKQTLAFMVEQLYKDTPGLLPGGVEDAVDLSTYLTGV